MTLRDIPNLITLLRLLLLAPFVIFLLDEKYAAALLVFAVAGISDGIDGYLARRRGWTTPLGAIIDPLADKLLMATAYIMLGWLDLIAHTILIMAYHLIKEQCTYRELGADYFDRLHEAHIIKRLTSRIQALGYKVDLEKLPVAA